MLDVHAENLHIQTLLNDAGTEVEGVNGIGNGLDNLLVGNSFGNFLSERKGTTRCKERPGRTALSSTRCLARTMPTASWISIPGKTTP